MLCCILFNFSCTNEVQTEDYDLFNSWEVLEYKPGNNAELESDAYKPVIEFSNEGTYTLKLDRNSCIGNYEYNSSGTINISLPGCTKICCDSESSVALMQLLTLATAYTINDTVLNLEIPGGGWIALQLKSNEKASEVFYYQQDR